MKLYTLRQVAMNGMLPFRSPQTIVKEIESGRLKATTRGKGLGKRYLISDIAIKVYLEHYFI